MCVFYLTFTQKSELEKYRNTMNTRGECHLKHCQFPAIYAQIMQNKQTFQKQFCLINLSMFVYKCVHVFMSILESVSIDGTLGENIYLIKKTCGYEFIHSVPYCQFIPPKGIFKFVRHSYFTHFGYLDIYWLGVVYILNIKERMGR